MRTLELSKAKIKDVTIRGNAEFTGRCLPAHLEGMSEMEEKGTINGVPVCIYYMLDEVDCAVEDLSNIDWDAAFDRIEIDPCECDRQGITDDQIDAVIAKFGGEK